MLMLEFEFPNPTPGRASAALVSDPLVPPIAKITRTRKPFAVDSRGRRMCRSRIGTEFHSDSPHGCVNGQRTERRAPRHPASPYASGCDGNRVIVGAPRSQEIINDTGTGSCCLAEPLEGLALRVKFCPSRHQCRNRSVMARWHKGSPVHGAV